MRCVLFVLYLKTEEVETFLSTVLDPQTQLQYVFIEKKIVR